MKLKYIFLFLTIIITIFFSCTVNENTGLIKVENHTKKELKNVYVGKTLITRSVAAGEDYYYWYFDTISGKVESENIDVFNALNKEYEFEKSYWVTITASVVKTQNGEEPYLLIKAEKQGP